MHELSIVQALIEQVEREVRRAGHAGRVVRLDLSVGRLSGVCPDSLRFAFDLLAPESIVAGSELRITEPQAVCACRDCGARTAIDDLVLQCPACGSGHVAIEGGQELLLETIDLEDSPPSPSERTP
jgi:hydrogenase nickel incorporation protein HypA/HybF